MNLPGTTYDADPRAPWNRGDPFECEVCATCRWFRRIVVLFEEHDSCVNPDFDQEIEVDGLDCACGGWESRWSR